MDAYSPCPCGSGQKFKWCCHKVESFADRAQRLVESGQFETAIQALDEGLKKEPGNAWLLTRKCLIQIRSGKPEEAVSTVKLVLKTNPRHAGALTLLTRLSLEIEGATAGAAQLQHALSAFAIDGRRDLAPLVKLVGAFLTEAGEYPAALKHLELAKSLRPKETDESLSATIRTILGNATIPPWQKHPYRLASAPSNLSADALERFGEALAWAREGLWAPAAAAFDLITDDPIAGPLADLNIGLCRLWLADGANAIEPLRRYVATLGATPEAIDLEALCQQFDTPRGDDLVEQVQLIWPLRNRQALLDALNSDQSIHKEDTGPLDPEDEESPEVDRFAILDRPRMDAAPAGLTYDQIPKVVGRILVGAEIAALESFDDGRLDDLTYRLRSLAGISIANAHPRTKVLDKVARLQLALTWEWLFPEGLTATQARAFNSDYETYLIRTVWEKTPNRALRRRTPLQAAQAGDAQVPLRAAVCQLEQATRTEQALRIDFPALRQKLRIPAEPAIDPITLDVETINLARLSRIPVERLNDDQLVALYRRARQYMIRPALKNAAEALTGRPVLQESTLVSTLSVYADLASIAALEDHLEEASTWLRRGREADIPSLRSRNAPAWDMLELRMKARSEVPEVWVPELAVIIDRYTGDSAGSQTVMMNLLEMRLVELVPNPDGSGEYMLDTRHLQNVMSEYGPRVTTTSGRLGVSATKPEIWTPGTSPGGPGGGSGLWTPGAGTRPAQGGKSNLILPGR